MKPDVITNIIQSPQWSASLLWHFISGAQQYSEGLKTELIFLGIPVLTDKYFKDKLLKANKTSTLSSLFTGKDLNASFASLPERVIYFKGATRAGIIYLGSITEVKVEDRISVTDILQWDKERSKARRDFLRAAFYLGGILAKENHLAVISRFIGVGYEHYLR